MSNNDNLKKQDENLNKSTNDISNILKTTNSKYKKKLKQENYEDASNNKNLPESYPTLHDATIHSQNVGVRRDIQQGMHNIIEYQNNSRKILIRFFLLYMFIITLGIFWVVIDPVALFRDKPSYYPDSIKLSLLGVFLVMLYQLCM